MTTIHLDVFLELLSIEYVLSQVITLGFLKEMPELKFQLCFFTLICKS